MECWNCGGTGVSFPESNLERECEEGDYIVVDGVLIDTRDATFTCDGCGRTGTRDDLCVHGDPCPDEECTGTVSVVTDG